MPEFLAMGGYGTFVWTAFACTGLVLVWNIWAGSQRVRAAEKRVRLHLARRGRSRP